MAHTRPQLKAEKRELLGKKVKHLRASGKLPASVYGHEFESLSIQLDQKTVEKIFGEVGESGLVDLVIGEDKALPILFKNPQYHPIEGKLIHVDLHKVNLKEKITTMIPVVLVGESSAVKAGNVMIQVANEVEIEALPTELPEKFEIDISKLENVDQMITVADLVFDKDKIEVKTGADQVIVKIEEPKEEIIEEPVAAEGVGGIELPPATEQKAPEEGEGEKKEE